MPRLHFAAVSLMGLLALGACVEISADGGPAGSDQAQLRALGYKTAAKDDAGKVIAMSYSGPVTAAVVCGPSKGPFAPLKSQITDLDGGKKRVTLDSYMILSDGSIQSGIYAIVLHKDGGAPEGIDFKPGEMKSFSSGLTCKGA